ncbi:hypothetical protein SAMN02745196_00788 [Clostridium collagenovorans DSM 3089]|uniref:Uncharacterized protein n=1 Tax=Clostridium collagenovorans DSM 3089 TaxID=1121306 RepID=A0A1M5TZU2_9CLOT|nr:hypothetical protein [Clostridium collagenovorans]SHH56302.1 hypothetical protein SAMN02745196_00788 [Clostridium collagenovorans DSM 3089]
MELFALVIMALLCEAIWETLKMIWQNGKFSIDRLGALICGVVVALVVKVDMFSLVGLTQTTSIIGIVLTGIVISRGANFVHDLINTINNDKSLGNNIDTTVKILENKTEEKAVKDSNSLNKNLDENNSKDKVYSDINKHS